MPKKGIFHVNLAAGTLCFTSHTFGDPVLVAAGSNPTLTASWLAGKLLELSMHQLIAKIVLPLLPQVDLQA